MSLPVVHGTWWEKELCGCPIVIVGGGEYVSLDRVAKMLGVDRKGAAKQLANAYDEQPLFPIDPTIKNDASNC
jgi:hypothetical protein